MFELINWVGSVSDVRPELLKMDVFAYSVNPQEGLGIALVEAMAAGLPCVAATMWGACQEVLDWGKRRTIDPEIVISRRERADALVQAAEQAAISAAGAGAV